MNPQDVRAIIEAVIDARLSLQWYVIGLSLLAAAVIGGSIAWLSSYFQVKAQNFANREDLNKLTEQLAATTRATEAIKAEISGELWVKQKRWDFKQQCYSALAENFGEQAAALHETRALLELQGSLARGGILPSGLDSALIEKKIGDRRASVEATTEQIRRLGSKVRIAVSPEVRTLLSQVGDRWNSVDAELPFIDQVAIRRDIAHSAWIDIMEAARRDLFREEES